MSGSRGSFGVTITAIDQATATIDRINRKIQSVQAPVQRMQRSLARFASLTGLDRLSRGFDSLARGALNSLQALGRIVEPLGIITGAASVAGIYRLVSAFGQWGTGLSTASARIGITASRLNAMQGAARLAGDSAEGMTAGLQGLNQTLTDAVGGRSPEALQYFNLLGVNIRDASGNARNAADVFPELIDALNGVQDPTLRARAGTALLGGAYDQLQRTIAGGSRTLRQNGQIARGYAGDVDRQALAAIELKNAETQLQEATEGLGNTIAAELAPTLGPILRDMAGWIKANRDWIATGIGDKARELNTWLRGIDWGKIATDMRDIATGADSVATALGGWKTVGEGLLIFYGASWVTKMLAPFATVLRMLALIPGSGVTAGALASVGIAALPLALSGDTAANDQAREAQEAQRQGPEAYARWQAQNPNIGGRVGNWWQEHAPTWLGGRKMGAGGPADETASFRFWKGKGLSDAAAASMAAQEMAESGGDARAVGDNGQALGGYQWHADRRQRIRLGTGIDIATASIEQQREAAFWELTQGGEGGAYRRLQTAGSLHDASIGATSFERPGNLAVEQARREARAREILARNTGAPYATGAPGLPPLSITPNPPIALGTPANIAGGTGSATQTAQTVRGSADLQIHLNGFPENTRTTSTVRGDLFEGPPRIMQSLPAFGP
jgi:hypothetical protein